MPGKTKKILKVLATVTLIESIASFIAVIILIGGVVYIISEIGNNLVLSVPACIIYALVIIFVYFKVAGAWNRYFKNK